MTVIKHTVSGAPLLDTSVVLLPSTKEEVNAFARIRLSVCLFVCPSVCLSVCKQDYSKTCTWIWMKCCMSTDIGTWTNWLTFEPDPDYSPDAGTRLLSPILYALQCGILLYRVNPTYRYLAHGLKWFYGPPLQRRVVLHWFYSLRAVGTNLSEVHALYQVPF